MVIGPLESMGKPLRCPEFTNTGGVLAQFPPQPSNLQYVYQIEVLTEYGVSVKPGTACDVTSAESVKKSGVADPCRLRVSVQLPCGDQGTHFARPPTL